MVKWAVVYKDSKAIYAVFDTKSEANYCVTDSFGPEGNCVEVKEIHEGPIC